MPLSRYLLAPAAVAALALAGDAVAASAPVPDTFHGGEAVPAAKQSLTFLTGKASAPVPVGWTVLVWKLDLDAGASVDLRATCPAGSAIATFQTGGPGDPPIDPEVIPSDVTTVYGAASAVFSASATQTASAPFAVVCVPKISARTTIVHGRSPVTFPPNQIGVTVHRGRPIPDGWRIFKSVVPHVPRSGGLSESRFSCPAPSQPGEYAVARSGQTAGTTLGEGNGFTLRPSAHDHRGPLTVYTLCWR